jgi:hypothetical protein
MSFLPQAKKRRVKTTNKNVKRGDNILSRLLCSCCCELRHSFKIITLCCMFSLVIQSRWYDQKNNEFMHQTMRTQHLLKLQLECSTTIFTTNYTICVRSAMYRRRLKRCSQLALIESTAKSPIKNLLNTSITLITLTF